ncbi:transcriptional regulator ATRX-like [Myxocyprinus asiaticus]|uniref:transcriptional regulator ATRX-like n=1 Tax=Myxocyprinus asiaticus TaxID=70543 RepID=UPI0022213C46|nr:transcriptional regulator ATRX-like [Myxocyprinus asiaticus]
MPGETETDIPATGAVFTFGKSTIAGNVPSRLWLKNDTPVQISCGQSHSAFVTEQGRLFVFGSNSRGQLGLVTKGPATKPICVKALKVERIQFVACGTDHTLVSTLQGEVFATGGNSDGQLGLGHCNDSISFQRLHPFCDSAPIRLLSAGNHTSAVLTEDGRLFLWGDNSVGQLGLGNDSHALLPKELKLGQPVQWVSCGYRHSALVTNNGDVFTFGESADGRLGLSADQLANHNYPQRVDSLQRVLQVACGGKHTLALTEDELYSCGRGEFGQLGLGTLVFEADSPVAVGHFRKGRVTYVTCGENHSALITDSGLLYTFGDGRHGKLGHGDENFTNQFSPTVCQRFFDYYAMTVACGSSHTLVFARPRQQESEDVCLEDEDVTYFYLDRCFNSMLQGQPLEHIPEPALISQPAFLAASLPSSHRWSLSTRSRRRQRESSSAQFGPEFLNIPPLTTSFTTLSLTGDILQPRSLTDTPKHFKTDASKEFSSTSVTQPAKYDFSSPARTPPFSPVSKSARYIHNVGTAENSMSDKKQNEKEMARLSSVGRVETRAENAPQQTLPTELQTGSVSHQSLTESLPPSNRKCRKRRSGDPGNTMMKEHLSVTTASQSETESKIYKKPTQIKNNKSKGQPVVVKSSPDRMLAQDREKSNETPSTNTDTRGTIAKDVGSTKVKDRKATTLGKIKPHIKSSPVKIQDTSSLAVDQKETKSDPVQTEQVKTTPTKVQEVKSPYKFKEVGSPVKAIKRVRPPIKVQDVLYGAKEDGEVESTPCTDAQRDVKPSLGKSQEVRSTLINIREQGNTTTVKIPAKIQNAPEKGKGKNDVDTKENTGAFTPKKAKTPSPLSVSIPKQREGKAWGEGARGMSKAKKRKPVEAENFQLRPGELGQETTGVKRQNDNVTLKDSNIYFPLIENRQSSSNTPATEKSQSASNLQFDHKKSQSSTNKALNEQKQGFPSIKTLASERSHSFSGLWSNNQSATNESSTSKETESSFGKLLSPSSSLPQHRQSPLKENKLAIKTVESEPVLVTETSQSVRKPQAEQSIMGSVVSSLPSLALASGAPLLIKAADVLSETSNISTALEQSASIPQETTGNNIQKGTVQDVSAISENQETGDSSTKKQSESTKGHPEGGEDRLVSDEKEMLECGNAEREDEEDEKDSEMGEEKRDEEENFAKEEDESEGGGQEKQNSPVEEAEEGESVNDGNSRDGESAEKGLEEGKEEEGEEEENGAAGDEEGDSDTGQSSNSGKEKSEGEGSGDSEVTSEDNEDGDGEEDIEESEIQESGNNDSTEKKEEGEKGEAESEEEKDKECGGEEEEERDEKESWDEGSEREVEDDETKEKTDVEKEQEGESSNDQSGQEEEKMERGKESDNEDEENKEGSDEEEEKGESEEKEDGSEIEEEEYETGEEEEEEKVKSEGGSNGEEEAEEGGGEEEDEVSEEDSEVGNEVEKEIQEEESDHEQEEEENGDQANEEEENEEEENEEEENGMDEEENNEQLKDRKGEEDEEEGVEEEEEESDIDEEEEVEEEEDEATKGQREKIEYSKSVTKKPANAKDSQGHENVNAENEEKERQKTAEGNEDSERQELGEKIEVHDGGKEEGEWKIDASEEEGEEGEAESEEDKDKESGDEEEEERDEGSEREVEDDETKEKTDVVEEQEGESSNDQSGQEEEKMEQGKESDNEDEENKEGSDDEEEKGENEEEEDGSEEEEEEYETEEEEQVKSEGGSNGKEEADEGDGEEDDEESEEDDEVGNEVEKENQEEESDHEEEEEENGDQANEEEENEEEENGMDEEENNEQLKERKSEEDEEECVEEGEEESEIDEEEEVEEEEEEATKGQREKNEYAKSVTKEPANAKDSQGHEKVNAEKERHKRAEGSKDRERQELSEKIEVMDSVDEEHQGDKLNEMMEEHEEEKRGSEEEVDEEEEETEQKVENITAEKNGSKQRANYEQEEESEEEEEDGEEEESEEEEEEEEEKESDEEEEEEEERIEQRRAPKQSIKPKALSVDRQGIRQTIAQRDREKTVKRDQQNLQGKKQTASGAQDPQFWNNVLPQYLNLK